MTVISKPSNDKKSDNLEDPLVDNIVTEHPEEKKIDDGEAGQYGSYRSARYYAFVRNRQYYFLALALLVIVMVITCVFGVLGTEYMIRRYHAIFVHESPAGTVEYVGEPEEEAAMYEKKEEIQESDESKVISRLLSELAFWNAANEAQPEKVGEEKKDEFGTDLEKTEGGQISLPEKPKDSRYVHDYYNNLTAIVDVVNERCFIMDLDRTKIPLPDGLNDLIDNLGKYYVDTSDIRASMHVVLPSVKDLTKFGSYISAECTGYTTYKLEKNQPTAEVKPENGDVPKLEVGVGAIAAAVEV